MDKVFIVIDVNFEVMDDISIPCVFGTLGAAFDYAIKDVENKNGKDIKLHGYSPAEVSSHGYLISSSRVTNNNSLGSDYGVTYKSHYGSYPCARMIMERKVN